MAMKIDWSDIPSDLIGEIAKNVCTVEDFVVFSAVCRSWRSTAVVENWKSGRQLPWLVLNENDEDREGKSSTSRGFFNLNNNKRYDLDVPQLRGCRIWGSSIGWMCTVNIQLEIHLINPLSRLTLSLPHLSTLKHTSPILKDPARCQKYFIVKALVFEIGTGTDNKLMVAIIYGEFCFLAMVRPGDSCWTEVEVESPYDGHFRDVFCFNGQIFALRECGQLIACQFDDGDGLKLVYLAPKPPDIEAVHKFYLAEHMGGLLMIVRFVVYDDEYEFDYKTLYFDVYRMDFNNNKWIEVENLGDRALFVGDSYSMSFLCSSDDSCQANSIYFTDDNSEGEILGHDMGVFDLEQDESNPLVLPNNCCNNPRSTLSFPFWMMPNLF